MESIRKYIIDIFESNPNRYFKKYFIYNIYCKIKEGNINISDIYTCLNEFECYLYVNGQKAETAVEFGLLLRQNRKLLNITRLNLLTEKNISFTIINKIESGKNCKKSSLDNYIKSFPNLKIEIKR